MSASVSAIRPGTDSAPMHLGADGKRLWRDILADHDIDDGAGRALLTRACEAMDRLRQVQARLKEDGLMDTGYRKQPRPHPLLAVEAEQSRILLATFRASNLDLSP